MKKYFLALLALTLTVGIFAFIPSSSDEKATTEKWYIFTGGDPDNPMDYEVHVGPPPSCVGDGVRCAVFTVRDLSITEGDFPDLLYENIVIEERNP